jgi:D-alanyl-D-alanine carboxypeptidase
MAKILSRTNFSKRFIAGSVSGIMLVSFFIYFESKQSKRSMNNVESTLTNAITKGETPSVQYHFFDEHQILDSFRRGYANIARAMEVDHNTTYHAFSVTKTFTALAVVQLAEKGVLHLDHPVERNLPQFPYGHEITIRQLLAHTAGIPNPIPLP